MTFCLSTDVIIFFIKYKEGKKNIIKISSNLRNLINFTQHIPTPKGVFALPSSAVLKPAQAGLVMILQVHVRSDCLYSQ